MNRRKLLLASTGVLTAACSNLNASKETKSQGASLMKYDTSNWKTHTFGRFLIDLPPDAIVTDTYNFGLDRIKWRKDATPESYEKEVQEKVAELRRTPKLDDTPSKVEVVKHQNGTPSISIFWAKGFNYISNEEMGQNTYNFLVSTKPERLYFLKSDIGPGYTIAQAMKDYEGLSSALKSWVVRDMKVADPLPKVPAFVMDGAYFERLDGVFWNEGMRIGVSFPKHPRAYFTFDTQCVGRVDPKRKTLLQRSTLERAAKLKAKVLRYQKRDISTYLGEEIGASSERDGQPVWFFKWESNVAKEDSVDFPVMNCELNVLERTLKPKQFAFSSDEEAVALWDALLATIRLRPNAV